MINVHDFIINEDDDKEQDYDDEDDEGDVDVGKHKDDAEDLFVTRSTDDDGLDDDDDDDGWVSVCSSLSVSSHLTDTCQTCVLFAQLST